MTQSTGSQASPEWNPLSANASGHDAPVGRVPTIGIGAGTGGLPALLAFLQTLPTESGLAFVIVAPQPLRQGKSRTALQGATTLPVIEVTAPVTLLPNHVYVAPAQGIQLEDGQLRPLMPVDEQAITPIDAFFLSLAATQGPEAVAILLAGKGEDGVAGLQAIRAQGGWTLVQTPAEAAQPALPRRAIEAGLVETVAPVGELAEIIIQRLRQWADGTTSSAAESPETKALAGILDLVYGQTGHDLSGYKRSTLLRRIVRRMQMAGAPDLARYLEVLRGRLPDVQALYRDCLISVTNFFRDPHTFELFERECIPELFANKLRHDTVRVWVVGCATGEEAYSIAMLLAEQAAKMGEPPRIQVFATDVDEEAISVARRGVYPPTIAEDIAPARLERFFVREEHEYRVKTEIRELVLFAVHNVLKDPPFSKLDLICCRNLLIYFEREAQEKTFELFHYALNPNAYLFLGTAESAEGIAHLFTIRNKRCHLYQRRDSVDNPVRRLPATLPPVVNRPAPAPARLIEPRTRSIEELYQAWSLRHYAPPRLLVDEHYDVTHIFGGADRYLHARDGAVTQNLLQKVAPGLRLELRAALYQALTTGERTVSRPLQVEMDGATQVIQLHVGPVDEPGFPKGYVEVVFLAVPASHATALPHDGPQERDQRVVERLEEELLRTRERLQTVIEEHEVAHQELTASNEELQSINEELKSTTEELEISKEELQSMNEELSTVNYELKLKLDELSRANSDLQNLIASTDVGTIFLDRALRIKRFTPRATDLFYLIDTDLGRPFAHIAHRLRHGRLLEQINHVLESQEEGEEIVQSKDDRWFILRLLPYRTVEDKIDGVAITFVDISDLKRAESELQQRIQQQAVADLGRQALAVGDLAALFDAATARIAEVLGTQFSKLLELQPDGQNFHLVAGAGWPAESIGQVVVPNDRRLLAGFVLHTGEPLQIVDIRTEERFALEDHLRNQQVVSGMTVLVPGPEQPYGVLGVFSTTPRTFSHYDADFLQSVANLLGAAVARAGAEEQIHYQAHLLDAVEQSVVTMDMQGTIVYWNRFAEQLYGWRADEAIGRTISEVFIPPGLREESRRIRQQLVQGQSWNGEFTVQRKDGSTFPAYITDSPIYDEHGTQIGVVGVSFDISERKRAEEALRASEERYRTLFETMDEGFCIIEVLFDDQDQPVDYRFVETNPAFERLTGLPLALDKTASQLVPDLERDWFDIYGKIARTGEPLRFTLGSAAMGRWFDVYAFRVGEPQQRRVAILFNNVTERKAAEEALRESEARFRTLADSAPVLIWINGSDGGCEFVNHSYLDFFGKRLEEVQGFGWQPSLHPDDAEPYVSTYLSAFAARAPFRAQARMQHADGHYHWLESYGVPHFSATGEFLGYIGSSTDITEIKEAEAALRAYAQRLQLALAAGQIGTFTWHVAENTFILDERCAAQFGAAYQPGPVDATPFFEQIHPDDRQRVGDVLAHFLSTGSTYQVEYRIILPDGSSRWLTAAGNAIRNEAGVALRVEGVNWDITASKQAEADARFLDELGVQMQRTGDVANLVTTVTRLLGEYLAANQCVLTEIDEPADRLTVWPGFAQGPSLRPGVYALAEFSSHLLEELRAGQPVVISNTQVDPRTADRYQELYQPLGAVAYVAAPLVRTGQWLANFSVRAAEPRAWGERELELVQTVAERLWSAVEQVRLHEALRASEQQLRQLANAMPQIVWTTDANGQVTYLNDRWVEYTGLPVESGLLDPAQAIHLEDRAVAESQWAENLQRGTAFTYEMRLRRHDGVYRWHLVRTVPVADLSGQIVRWYGTSTDIDDRVRSELDRQLLSELDAHYRLEDEPEQMIGATVRALGHHLNGILCSFAEVDLTHANVLLHRDWRKDQPPREGRFPLSDFLAPGLIEEARQGRTVVVADVASDERTRERFAKGETPPNVRSVIMVPCLRNSHWVGLLVLAMAEPHAWRTDEMLLLEAAATRLWSAVEKARAEQALRASEAELRLITDNVPGLISYVDRNQRYRFVNATYARWFDRPNSAIVGCSVLELVDEATYARVRPYIETALAGERVTFESEVRYADGLRTVLATYVPDVDEAGVVQGFYALVTDITAHKRNEQVMHFLAEASTVLANSLDYEATLETVANLAVPHIADWCAVDLQFDDGHIEAVAIAHVDPAKVAWGYELRRRYPIDPAAPVGVPNVIRTGVSDFYPVITDEMLEQAAQTPEDLALLRQIGYSSLMTVPLQARDRIFGAITFVATESKRYFTERDLAVAQDVARRAAVAIDNARLFRALQHSEERSQRQLAELQGVYASAPVGLAVLDPELRYLRVNEALAQMNGLPADVHIGRRAAELIPNLSSKMDDLVRNVLKTGEPLINYESSSDVPASPGQERSWLQSIYPLRAADGQIVGLNAVVQDITERKRQEAELKSLTETLERRVEERTAELERSNRELDQFAYVASHDLKAPLRGIGQLATWISEDAEPVLPEKSKEHLAKLQGRIRRMNTLLDDLLAYSRAGRVRHAPEPVDITALVRDLVETLAPPAGFDIRIQPQMPTLRTERVALELVLRNLIGNAIKHHNQREGVVEITAQETDDWIEIAVRDNGPGIAPEYHGRIFEMFQTLQPRDRVEGSGMGLAIVKRTLEVRGGTITLESAVGVGTTFRFTWPKRAHP
jgi:PAS domain S-box-containing protein